MRHLEFFHREHFAYRYHRMPARKILSPYIDFFWETDFESLWKVYPDGFADALFPNVGYTYMLNLGTPFIMELPQSRQEVKTDAFLPRSEFMVCYHQKGARIFGIKFRVSPMLLKKKVNFSEYRGQLYPLAYLIDRGVTEQCRALPNFEKRVSFLSEYFSSMIEAHAGAHRGVAITTEILHECALQKAYETPVETWAARYNISSRTLQRYFEATTGMGTKEALQLLRIRQALEQLSSDPSAFQFETFAYYDYSHFYRHMKAFLHGAGEGAAAQLFKEVADRK